jgi:hypothetical protein
MSYFGNQGPAQDGGFIGGIARGKARLDNAKNTRARYSKGLGAVDFELDRDSWRRFIPGASEYPPDAVLYNRAKKFTDYYQHANETKDALDDGRISKQLADPVIRQYENDKKLIAQWAESGPYVKETTAFAVGTAPFLLAIGVYASYKFLSRKSTRRARKQKEMFGAVFA